MKKLFVLANVFLSFYTLSAQGKWETVPVPFKHTLINTIVVDEKNNKWLGTDIGVFKYDNKNWKSFSVENGLPNNAVEAIAIDSKGLKWFGTDNGLSVFTIRLLSTIRNRTD